jgi:hypothetical protein
MAVDTDIIGGYQCHLPSVGLPVAGTCSLQVDDDAGELLFSTGATYG